MKRILTFLVCSIMATSAISQINDTVTLRSYINTNVVPNSTRSITATQLNFILNGNLNILPNLLKRYYDSVWISSGTLYVRKNSITTSYAVPVNTHTHPQSEITGLVDSISLFRTLINSLIADSVYQASQISQRVRYVDTSGMLAGYPRLIRFIDSLAAVQARLNTKLNAVDTSSLSTRINQKLNITDTSGKWIGYGWLSSLLSSIGAKVAVGDTAAMLTPYAKKDGSNASGNWPINASTANQATQWNGQQYGGIYSAGSITAMMVYQSGQWKYATDAAAIKTFLSLNNVSNVDATNASNISSGTLADARLSSNVTLQGNTFNGANQLVKLDGSGKLPTSTIPSLAITETFTVASQAAMLALSAQQGDVAIRTDQQKTYILAAEPASTLSNWVWMQFPDAENDPIYTASSWYSTTNNSTNWNTAYSWGNHAAAGYAMASRTITINGTTYDLSASRSWTVGDVLTSGSYSNPAWITALAWSKLTGVPSTFTPSSHTHPYSDLTGTVPFLPLSAGASYPLTGNLIPGTNASYDLGSSSLRWTTVYAYHGSFNGNMSVGGVVTVGSLGIQSPTALIGANYNGDGLEFGHGNSAGYRGHLGAQSSSGQNYLVFHGEHGTNANTFRTRGIRASIIISDASGGFAFGNVSNTNADNQTFVTRVGFSPNGDITALGDISTDGNLTFKNTGYIRYNNTYWYGRNVADNAWKQLIGINTSDKVSIDGNGIGTVFGSSVTTTGYIEGGYFVASGATGLLVLASASWGANSEVRNNTDLNGVSGGDYMAFKNPSGKAFTWTVNGSSVANLTAGGTLTANGDVVAYYSSDRRLKNNIKPIANALAIIDQLGGYSYDWNNKQDVYTGHDYGVIAQEVEAVMPELVTTRANGYKAVKYERLIPLLIQAIKELKNEVALLKK